MAQTNTKPTPQRLTFVSGTTLGRSGHTPEKADRLSERLEHLDALLCLISGDEFREGHEHGFHALNGSMQSSVLSLASSLATEAHELQKEIKFNGFNAKFAA